MAGIFLGGLFGVAAIVLGVIGIFKSHRLMAILGIALAVVGLIVTVIVTITLGSAIDEVVEDWPTTFEDSPEDTEGLDDTDTEDGPDVQEDLGGPDGTDLNSPLPAGSEVETGNWRVSFSDVVPDATETVLNENQFNEPPADGYQYFMYRVEATYLGADSAYAWDELELGVAFDNAVHTEWCGVIPDDLLDAPEVYADGTASGNACVAVPSDSAEEAVISVKDYWNDGERFFVAID